MIIMIDICMQCHFDLGIIKKKCYDFSTDDRYD